MRRAVRDVTPITPTTACHQSNNVETYRRFPRQQKDQTLTALSDAWMWGKNTVPKQPRWSVVRQVRHWVKG